MLFCCSRLLYFIFFFFFFFQAEDGIRDLTVTGVQTCALPIYVRSPDGPKAKHAIVKEAPIVPHVFHCPPEDRMSQTDVVLVQTSKREKCDDALCDTMNVDRIGTVMKVSGCTIGSEKMGLVKLEPTSNSHFELCCLCVPANGLQRAQVISGVEVVDPSLCRGLFVGSRGIVAVP